MSRRRSGSRGSRTTQLFSRGVTFLGVSLLLLLPCFWQKRIQAIDLSSHIYNAWLAALIAQHKLQGLWIARQSNNVLFDLMLAWLLQHVGAATAQRIAVSASVLIFGWGSILFISRGSPRNWWFVLPSATLLSYGLIFHDGFFNFYLAMGICLWYLAIFISSQWQIRLLITPLLAVAWIAHPFPVAWAGGLAVYAAVAERLQPPRRGVLAISAVFALLGTHFALASRYQCSWSTHQAWYITGANQLFLYGWKYAIPSALLGTVWAMMLYRCLKVRRWQALLSDLHFQLWLLSIAAVIILPNGISFPQYAVPLEAITTRMSLAAGITLCALLVETQINRYEKLLLVLSAMIFFVFVFRDSREFNRLEDQASAAVARLPPGSRVIGQFPTERKRLNPSLHMIDRACIGHCFSYASFEPSSKQFRVRAEPGNAVVMTDYTDVAAVQLGKYRVRISDLPLFLVYSCGPAYDQVSSRELHAGDDTGAVTWESCRSRNTRLPPPTTCR